MFFFVSAFTSFISYANAEHQHVFLGQVQDGNNSAKTIFMLDLVGDDLENHVMITETGEVFLKVDKIVAIPRNQLFFYSDEVTNAALPFQTLSSPNAILDARDNEPEVRCSNCRTYYDPKSYRGRKCPSCGTAN